MAKYKVGDKVKLTVRYRGVVCIVTEVHENRPKYQYSAQKEQGRGGVYKLSDDQIEGVIGTVDVETLPNSGGRTEQTTGQAHALRQSQLYDGSPEGDRWLVLATTNIGDNIKIRSRGKVVNATLIEVKLRGLKYHFVAKLPTGGEYRYLLSAIVVEGEATKAPVTLTNAVKRGTLGELLAECQRLITEEHVLPNTPLLVASDEEGNAYNKFYGIQLQRTRSGRALIIQVMDDDAEAMLG